MTDAGFSSGPAIHSRAFENFVTEGDGDIVGLLAYALFKQAIREAAVAGDPQSGALRNPSPTSVNVHRGAAERLLSQVVDTAIDSARPDLEASAIRQSVEASEKNIKSYIGDRTGFWTAVLAGGVAWLASLIITVLIIWLSGKGDAVSALIKS